MTAYLVVKAFLLSIIAGCAVGVAIVCSQPVPRHGIAMLYNAWGGHSLGLCLQLALVTLAGGLTQASIDGLDGQRKEQPQPLARLAVIEPGIHWTPWETMR